MKKKYIKPEVGFEFEELMGTVSFNIASCEEDVDDSRQAKESFVEEPDFVWENDFEYSLEEYD